MKRAGILVALAVASVVLARDARVFPLSPITSGGSGGSSGGVTAVTATTPLVATTDGGSYDVACPEATAIDGGCVTGFAQVFGGAKTFQDGLFVDGGGTYSTKIRRALCLSSTNTGFGDQTNCTGIALSSPSSGQLSLGNPASPVFDINSTGAYFYTQEVYAGFAGANRLANGGFHKYSGVATGSLAVCGSNEGGWQYDSTTKTMKWCDGTSWKSASSSRGTITLAAGTGTATVVAGSTCVCSDSTAVAAVQCSVSSTTLTANGTGSDVIAYVCL